MTNQEVLSNLYKNLSSLTMYIEEREWVKAKVLLTNFQYIEKFRLVEIIYKYIKLGFYLTFSNYHLSFNLN